MTSGLSRWEIDGNITLLYTGLTNTSRIIYFQVIAAEGEQKASRALREASEVIAESSSALQLRYLQVCSSTQDNQKVVWQLSLLLYFFMLLQTLNSISAEKNSTIIFPLPIGEYWL